VLKETLAMLNLPLSCAVPIASLSLNKCYRLKHASLPGPCFLKILASERNSTERLQELKIQTLASQHQLAPAVLRSCHSDVLTWMLSPFYTTTAQATMDTILQLLQQLHQLPAQAIMPVDPILLTHSYLALAQEINPATDYLKILTSVIANLPLPAINKVALCHFDVHPGNFLVSAQKTYMVDFENAGVFDPWYDLAVFSFYLGLDASGTEQLLNQYPSADAHALKHCLYYQKICLCLFLAYLVYHLLSHNIPIKTQSNSPKEAETQFRQLIKTYWQTKPLAAQLQLEQTLVSLGLHLVQGMVC
jgi:thiamine kinase-like enzyme